jgi:hypothetical protein
MTQLTVTSPGHPDLRVAHAIPGRIRLLAPRVRGRSGHATEVARRLGAVRGVHRAHADPTTGSITVHYHRSALESAEFFAEIAAALGLIAAGLDPIQVEAMFRVLGISPAELRAAWGDEVWPRIALPVACLALGFIVGRRFG